MRSRIVVVTGLIALILINVAIVNKERLLATGTIVYLRLAPVDPRSLMQGDYMALRFGIENQIRASVTTQRPEGHEVGPSDGKVVVAVDTRRVAEFRRMDNDGQPLAPDEIALRYRVRNDVVQFATNAFFFQEGQGDLYTAAKYGEFRVADTGDLLLTGLCTEDLQRLGPPEQH